MLAHYEISAPLGEGGMGEVYRAEDTNLGREVAIKVLPAEVAGDTERITRFRREAKLLAALTHANVAAVYGFEEVDGIPFLVMELVEGEDLTDRIARGPMAADEATAISVQLVHGLQAAHEKGIVHRDLKPSNIKVTADNEVKILDFGLARAIMGDPSGSGELLESPTITAATQQGVILGTAAYMSPEQARGHQVDHRSDIWSFGVVLYEMLVGRAPFGGATVTDLLAAVVRAEPDWGALPSGTPSNLRRLLERCLEKDRRLRLQAIGDARFDLEAPTIVDEAGLSPRPRRTSAVVAAVLITLAAAAGWWLGAGRSPSGRDKATPQVRSVLKMPQGVRLAGWASPGLAISPDGQTIAYVGDGVDGKHLYVRRLEIYETVRVPDSEWAEGPFFSPDGEWIAFANGAISAGGSEPGRLRKYSIADGTTRVICEINDYFGGTWREDGTIFWADAQPGDLLRVEADGGSPQPVAPESDIGRVSFGWPQVLPGGSEALITVWDGEEGGRASIVDLDTGEVRDLGLDGHLARYMPSGHIVLSRADRRLEGARFDLESKRVVGTPAELLPEVSILGIQAGAYAASESGSLVYTTGPVADSGHELTEIALIRWNGEIERLPIERGFYTSAATSPDSSRIALSSGSRGMFILDAERGTRFELPEGDELHYASSPLWSPDGTEIVFSSLRSGAFSIVLHAQRTDGEGLPRALHVTPGEFYATSWVPDTRRVLLHGWDRAGDFEIQVFEIDLDGPGELRDLELSQSSEMRPMVSPDGRWLSYGSEETGDAQVYLRSYPDLGPKIPVGRGVGGYWSPDMKSLVILRSGSRFSGGSLWVVDLDWSKPRAPQPGVPRHLTDLEHQRRLFVDGAGRGLIGVFRVEGSGIVTEINLVQNWLHEVRKLLPEK